jgi:eukaryotic-like serine/threonine-protein kinase
MKREDIGNNETEPASSVDESARRALKDAPTDKLTRAVAKSKIAAALFAKREPVKLGRYHLLEQVGAGGMGVVWGAWDPELDRRVAIKVVKPELAAARERIVREGQALAKLSNPHVVPVYDVGVVDDQVYLVMEWVRGETLRGWADKPREIRDIVHAYREAAIGLAAAHDAGLVHRDFKPENAMLGTDGRVRVLDFGLAHAGGESGGIAGTPRYMAPEQKVPDGIMSAAVDQYAIGIALDETLPKPPPKWLAAIVAQATAEAPADRFPSMHALVAALGNDPARIRRRRVAIAGALGLAGATFAIGLRAADSAEERCAGGPAEIATAWDLAAEQKVREHLVSLGAYGTQLAQLAAPELHTYAKRWVGTQKAACRANDRGELTAALYTSQLACLTRAKVSLATVRDVLSTVTVERTAEALRAMRSLPAVEHCRLDTTPPPPSDIAERVAVVDNDVARARVLAFAVDPRALDASATAARAADTIGYPRQVGQASLVLGIAQLFQQKPGESVVSFDHAVSASLEANDTATAVEALARQIYAVGTNRGKYPLETKVVGSLELATAIAKGLTGDGAFARALYYNSIGVLKNAWDDRESARFWFREAARVRPAPSPENHELAGISGNLALVETDRTVRDQYLKREADDTEAAFGADHPFTLTARIKQAMFIEDPRRSLTLVRDQIDRYRTMHPHLARKVGQAAYQVVWLAEELGDVALAREALTWITEPSIVAYPLAEGYRALFAGEYQRTVREMTELANKLETAKDPWDRVRSVDANLIAALAAQKLDDRATAVARAEAALALLDKVELDTPLVQRRRGRLNAMLALAGAGNVAARKQAALAWARLAGGYEARIAQLTAE